MLFQFELVPFRIEENYIAQVRVNVSCDGKTQTRLVDLVHHPDRVFVQTDKPIYTVKEKIVHVRFIAVTEDGRPIFRWIRVRIRVGIS